MAAAAPAVGWVEKPVVFVRLARYLSSRRTCSVAEPGPPPSVPPQLSSTPRETHAIRPAIRPAGRVELARKE